MSLRRLGRDADAAKVLTPFRPDLPLLENRPVLERLLVYRGERQPASLLGRGEDGQAITTHGFALGHWHLVEGRPADAEAMFRRVVAITLWPTFGHLGAETELARMRREKP
jgi:hypothetical protein